MRGTRRERRAILGSPPGSPFPFASLGITFRPRRAFLRSGRIAHGHRPFFLRLFTNVLKYAFSEVRTLHSPVLKTLACWAQLS
jgi:hypothetical protein